jgi:hypothetical protein
MSRIIGYLIVAGITASPLRGQDVAQMQRRVDSTFREALLAQQVVRDYRAAHPPTFNFSDSIVAYDGRIKVYFDERFAPQIRAAVTEATKHLDGLGQVLARVKPMIFTVGAESSLNPQTQGYDRVQELTVKRYSAANPTNPNTTTVEGDPESIAYVLVRTVSEVIPSEAKLAQWTNGALPVAPGLDEITDWGSMRLTMVSSPSHLGRSCFFGDVRACRVFLSLDTVADPVQQMFDSAGRRLRVSYEPHRARAYSSVATDRCLAGNDEACVLVLEHIGGVRVLSSPYMRTSVVSHAIRVGGPRAAERLLTTKGTPGDALSAAARMPLDSLVMDWQRHLGEGSGRAGGNVPWTIAISSIAWVALCLFLALRGSRWR